MASQWQQIIQPNSVHDVHGLKERRLSTDFCHLRVGFSSSPVKDDDWAKKHAIKYGGFDAPKWRREHGIDYYAYAGQRIWPMLDRQVHNQHIDLDSLIKNWTLFRIIDQGIRHPTVCLWVAINAKGDRHFYREYYSTNRSIAMNASAIKSLTQDEPVSLTFIDPSTRKRGAETLKPLIDVYAENGLYCTCADNSFAGYDTVRTSLLSTIARQSLVSGTIPDFLAKLNPDQNQLLVLADKPAITFDLRFTSRCFQECCNLRWKNTKGDLSQKAEIEKPVDKDDDGPDCVRYAAQSPLYFSTKPSGVIKISSIRVRTKLKRTKNEARILEKQRQRAYIA